MKTVRRVTTSPLEISKITFEDISLLGVLLAGFGSSNAIVPIVVEQLS